MVNADTIAGYYRGRRVLITGGSGFIGSHLVTLLRSLGADIVNIDLVEPRVPSHAGVWQQGDCCDPALVEGVFRRHDPEIVFHLAAVADLAATPADLVSNVVGVRTLVDVIKALATRCHLVHFSTQLVVGPGPRPEHDQDFRPYTAYGESKANSEIELRSHGEGVRWTIVRPAAIWGPYHDAFASGTWKFIAAAKYILPSNRDALRSYGYVRNSVEQVAAIPMREPTDVDGTVLYIADETMLNSKWVDAFSVALRGKPSRRAPFVLLLGLAYLGECLRVVGLRAPFDLGRLERITTDYPVPLDRTIALLGCGSVDFKDGVAETVAWLRGTYRP